MLAALLFSLVTSTPTPPSTPPSTTDSLSHPMSHPTGPARLLVLKLERAGIDAAVGDAVDNLVLVGADVDGVEVVSQGELQRMTDVEAEKQAAGCSSSSCLAELAGALGAELVLFGTASQLGTTTTITLSLFDNRTTRVERTTLNVERVDGLPQQLPPAVRALVAAGAGVALDVDNGVSAGVVVAGVGAGVFVVSGVVVVVEELLVRDPARLGTAKQTDQAVGVGAVVGAAVGAVVGVAGAVLMVLE